MSSSESPFAGLIKVPAWFTPIEDTLYAPARFFAETIDRPIDQAVYMTASIVALACCFALKGHPGSPF